jgi:ankyrin repeat protein
MQGPGNAAVVALLVEAGADVNARTASDATPMHIAACSNSGDVIRVLVAAGGNARDNRAYKGGCWMRITIYAAAA